MWSWRRSQDGQGPVYTRCGPPAPPGYLSDTQSSGQTLHINTSLSTRPLSDSGAHECLRGEASPSLVMHRRETAEPHRCSGHTGETAEPQVQAEETRGQVASGERGRPLPTSFPSRAPDPDLRAWTDGSDQSLTPLYSPSLEGPERTPGTPREGTSLPPQPASCPFPGSNWTADPRENQHLGLPSTARRPQSGGSREPRPQRGGQQRAWERWGGGRGPWSEGGKQGESLRWWGWGRQSDGQEQPGGGRWTQETEMPDERRSSQTEKWSRGKREEGDEAVTSDGAGEGGGSWPGGAGAQPAQPGQPAQPPETAQLPQSGPPRGQSCPGAQGE